MKQLFLYRLFKHSKIAFAFIAIYILCYAILFYKKMDMVFFPYNSMYSVDFNKKNTAFTYAMKVNGIPVKITHQLYWKKDFLEQSLSNYCKYKKHHDALFLHEYLLAKFPNEHTRDFFLQTLTPGMEATMLWPVWYIKFAGYKMPENATIELVEYHFGFENNTTFIKDSMSIYKTTFL